MYTMYVVCYIIHDLCHNEQFSGSISPQVNYQQMPVGNVFC